MRMSRLVPLSETFKRHKCYGAIVVEYYSVIGTCGSP